jgi:helicase
MSSEHIIRKLLSLKKWEKLNVTQQMAVEAGLLYSRDNFVIIAPTSSGKTGVALLAALQTLEAGGRVLYLVPMTSLIADKERDFSDISSKIAGFNASLSDWDKADIVITTFENFYRTALLWPTHAKGFDLAIVDEFHVLYDKLRGFNLEKVITILKEMNVRTICLSATFEDKQEIREWLNAKLVLVPEDAREVKLTHNIIDISQVASTKQNNELCKKLLEMKKEPYLIFCTSRDSTSARAKEMCYLLDKIIINETELRERICKKILHRKRLTAQEEELIKCLIKGVGFHHSGLDPRLRSFVEELFARKAINYLFATTGLAYGVNFPAKTVVLADVSFYDPSTPSKRSPVPVYMYLQMAGRAGRPSFGPEGYAYLVIKKRVQQSDVAMYKNWKIEKATSRVGEDDNFRKTILELIYSGRRKDEEILSFFQNTFFNFQSERRPVKFVAYNLLEHLKNHVQYLHGNGFIESIGAAGYRLKELGDVTMEFLFDTFADYPLAPFKELNDILERDKKIRMDFSIIYDISRLFEGACLIKYPREKSAEVANFFEKIGVPISDQRTPEYSSYAIYYGWMENLEQADIEARFKVFASSCPQVAKELFKLLTVYEKLAVKKGITVPPDFKDFKDRVRFGVTAEELPFKRLRGIGRTTVRKMKMYCETFRSPAWNLSGSMLEIFVQIYKKDGERRFSEILQFVKGVGKGKKHEKILELVKSVAEKK